MDAGARVSTWQVARGALRRAYYMAKFRRYQAARPRRRPCVIIFPSSQPSDPASNLRAWLIAPELEKLGWRAVVVPDMFTLRQRQAIVRQEKPDVILMQQTRHMLNQPHYFTFPSVLDADDADILDPRHHDRIARAASDAAAVIGGSRFVTRQLGQHNARAYTLWTCTPRRALAPPIAPADRGPIVAWAHGNPLGYHLEAAFIRDVMTAVCRRVPCTFWLFGTHEAQATDWFAPIREAGGECLAIPPMGYDDYLAKVAEAAIGLQPISPDFEFSQGKSFGKVLAYLVGEVAVVAGDAVDHPLFFRQWENGVLAEHKADAWADAIVALLSDPALRVQLAQAGYRDFDARLTSDVFARRLDRILRKAAGLAPAAQEERASQARAQA